MRPARWWRADRASRPGWTRRSPPTAGGTPGGAAAPSRSWVRASPSWLHRLNNSLIAWMSCWATPLANAITTRKTSTAQMLEPRFRRVDELVRRGVGGAGAWKGVRAEARPRASTDGRAGVSLDTPRGAGPANPPFAQPASSVGVADRGDHGRAGLIIAAAWLPIGLGAVAGTGARGSAAGWAGAARRIGAVCCCWR